MLFPVATVQPPCPQLKWNDRHNGR